VSGWIGGACAEPTVVREALASLRDGQCRFVRLVGEGGRDPTRTEGVIEYPMTCHSGGTLEIYLEPCLPKPDLVLIGHGPVLEALATLAAAVDFEVVPIALPALDVLATRTWTSRSCIVIATHGGDDEIAVDAALRTPAGYVSLVASRKRAAALAERLRRRGVPADRLGALKAPAGLDLGAVTPGEIAVSILAEIVQTFRGVKPAGEEGATARALGLDDAVDPICGMTVSRATARHRTDTTDGPVFFCCAGCRDAFEAARGR
jgi:xanthine dehydrogenase accessory factor